MYRVRAPEKISAGRDVQRVPISTVSTIFLHTVGKDIVGANDPGNLWLNPCGDVFSIQHGRTESGNERVGTELAHGRLPGVGIRQQHDALRKSPFPLRGAPSRSRPTGVNSTVMVRPFTELEAGYRI